MKRIVQLQILFAIALVLQLVISPAQSFASETKAEATVEPVHYLALGDSLAFGVNSQDKPGLGYADLIAQTLKASGLLKSYNKGFATPGYTTKNILSELQTDVEKPIIGSNDNSQTATLHKSIATADLITISVGANDLFQYFKLNKETGEVTYDEAALKNEIVQVGQNYHAILKGIYQLNPKVQIYIMGYYNSFPSVDPALQPMINQLVAGLNTAIQQGAMGTPAIFVPTAEQIAKDYPTYLPNPLSVHLSAEGYQVVFEQFDWAIKKHYQWHTDEETLPHFPDIATSPFKDYIHKSVQLGLVKGHSDGTFKPNDTLNRLQAAAIIVRSLNLQVNMEAVAPFPDIRSYSKETQAEVVAAYQFGIVKGSNGKFHPTAPVTRAELALMLERTFELVSGLPYEASTTPFTDIGHLDAEAQKAIAFLYDYQIASGAGDQFMPHAPTTRGQAAKIFVNFASLQ
ncbi:S-layer homology domain-containing protein [Sporosarcina sp. HYO08]|uniref:S-layer homology domain-containing protein n=1 Tax=Sporosarcina sp. HYO08 TaxID=1759557 RepID=UPI0007970454|nr:S-layer homology domain-containing protein [Sporosarcina sp. HYO08]KXH80937.1 hypothetical protein AU377_09405 [Sporosarcina sp. HYO08]